MCLERFVFSQITCLVLSKHILIALLHIFAYSFIVTEKWSALCITKQRPMISHRWSRCTRVLVWCTWTGWIHTDCITVLLRKLYFDILILWVSFSSVITAIMNDVDSSREFTAQDQFIDCMFCADNIGIGIFTGLVIKIDFCGSCLFKFID